MYLAFFFLFKILNNKHPKSGRFPRLQIHLIGAPAKAALIYRDTTGTASHGMDRHATPFCICACVPRISYLPTEEERASTLMTEFQDKTLYGGNDGKNTGSWYMLFSSNKGKEMAQMDLERWSTFHWQN